jgi:pimeloyl-ACP methyl ester carboxylesterase
MVPPGTPRDEAIRRAWPAVHSDEFIAAHRDVLERRLQIALERPTPLYAFQRQVEAIQRFDTYDRLPQVQAPTLIITGSADRLVPPENSRILAERIPGARLHVIQGAGHSFPTETPEEAARVITEFLTGNVE